MNGPEAVPLAHFVSLTVYPPGEEPVEYSAERIKAAGIQGGTAIAIVTDDEGREVHYYGVPMKSVKLTSSHLVAPKGLGLIPPNS